MMFYLGSSLFILFTFLNFSNQFFTNIDPIVDNPNIFNVTIMKLLNSIINFLTVGQLRTVRT